MVKSLIKKALDKHTKSNNSRFSFLAISVFLIATSASAQIKIKDRVEISPEGLNITVPDGSITGDSINAVYLGYGGEVKLRLIHLTNFGLQLWEETLGKLQITGEETSLGTFPQWHKFIFYLLDPSTDQRYYPEHNDDIVWEMGSTIDFYPTHQPGEPYPWNPEDWWEINLDVDYSLAKIPPSEILSYLGNPFVASESFEMPITGSLYAIVYSHTNSNDALWMDLPDTQLLQSDLANHTAEVIEIGSFQAGEMIRFFITSSNSVVSGISLYPRSEYIEEPDNEGNIHLWSLYFEDWTDLMFDDLEVEIYIRPEGGYQGNVAVIITPEQLTPGDTASITFKRRFLNGSLEDFPEEQRFEVGMLEGCDAGQILVDGALAPYFEEVNQPIYFVAASDLTETDTVKVRVGLIESGASRPMQTKDKDREIITLRKNKTPQQKPLGENTATYCFIGEIDWPNMGDGFVVVGDECENYPCSSIQLFPPLKIKTKPIYENVVKGLNLCYENSAGVTVFPFDNKPISPFYSDLVFDKDLFVRYEVDACFNKLANNGDGGWQFLISSEGEEHTIKLNVYIALCLGQISLTKINSKSQLESIPKDYVCAALKDFDNARPYQFSNSKLPKPKFYHIVDVTLIHEHVHKKFFEVDIKSVIEKSIYYNGKLLTYAQHFAYTPNCNNEYWELTSAISAGKNYFRDLFKKFAKDLEKESNIRSLNKYENENYTQWNTLVQDMITQYQEALIKIWKDKNLPKNESPLTNCNYTFKDKWKAFDKWRNIFEY